MATGTIDYLANDVITPKMKVRWAFTARPDTKYGDAKYKVEVWYDKTDKEQKAFMKMLLDLENAYLKENGKELLKKPSALKACKKTGKLYLRAESKCRNDPTTGQRKPCVVVDAKKQRCDQTPVFSEDVVRICVTVGGWFSNYGIGAKLYLNSVQVLVSNYRPGVAPGDPIGGFAEEDGFEGGDTNDVTEEAGTEEAPFEEEEGDDVI